ncbi:MAG: hypothetical protein SPE56_11600 [Prevotella sp.]|nr:hypothetical protein [Prevotella sp.]
MKVRKIIILSLFAFLMGTAFTGCNKGASKSELQSQLDSLSRADSLHQDDIRQMTDFVNVMSSGLDSISAQEGIIKEMDSPEHGHFNKAELQAQLQNLGQLLQRQRDRIAELEQEVAGNKSAYGQRIAKLIANYKAQLNEKDAKIAELQKQLNDKDANIAELTKNVNSLTTTNTQLNQTVETQRKTVETQQTTIAEQDASLHTGFVVIGTSKELKAKGIIKGGFLTKKKVNVSNLNATGFSRVDIRNYNDIRLNSSDPKIMTQMPSDSYEIVKNNNGTSTLHIKDASIFWSVSKYLVIKL